MTQNTIETSSIPSSPVKKKSEAYAWFVVGVLSFATIVSYIDRQVINLLVEPIKASLSISDTQISLLQGFSFAIFYAVLALPIARLADTGKRTRLINLGIITWTLATFSCGLAIGFWTLFLARVFVGAGEATLTPSSYSMIGDYFRKDRLPLAISLFVSASFIGSGIALIAGAYVIDLVDNFGVVNLPILGELESWQLIFMLVSLPSILLLMLMRLVKEPTRTNVGGKTAAETTFKQVFIYIGENSRVYIAIFVGFTLMASAQFGIGAWAPSFFIRTFGWSPSEIGFALGLLTSVCATCGVLFGGWFSGYLTKRGVGGSNFLVSIGAALACIPFAIAFPLQSEAAYSLAFLGPVLFFGAMPFGAGTSTLPQIAPNRMRAQVVAIYLLFANLFGFTIGPTIIALMTDIVFEDPMLIRYSLATVLPIMLLCGAGVVSSGVGHYKALLKEQDALLEGE
ncbi:MAG: MFS family permease [Gammaproteobacteria bacterium]|jgi:MFS family permease